MTQSDRTVFHRLGAAIAQLEDAIGVESDAVDGRVSERILVERTERIARQPIRVDSAPDTVQCMLFERSGRQYAVLLHSLLEVAPLRSVARLPGIPEAFLGVTARRGRVVSVVDVPVLFGSAPEDRTPPRWLVLSSSPDVVCGVAADEVRDIVDIEKDSMTGGMPTFPALVQRHTFGVLEDRTVVLDLVGLLEDKALRVEERGA